MKRNAVCKLLLAAHVTNNCDVPVNLIPESCICSSQDEKPLRISTFCYRGGLRPDKEITLLAKCANPSCSTPLVYLREGKIFMVESSQTQPDLAVPIKPKTPNRVEHFWLCGPCSAEMTLTFDRLRGVEVVRKVVRMASRSLRAAAS